MKVIPIIYTVRGTGPFPIDMLREDGSSPHSLTDSTRIEWNIQSPGVLSIFQITLIKHNGYHHWTPNCTRWKSFGWDVIIVEEKKS